MYFDVHCNAGELVKELENCSSRLNGTSALGIQNENATSSGANSVTRKQQSSEPPKKKLCSSLFSYDRSSSSGVTARATPEAQLIKYLAKINLDDVESDLNESLFTDREFSMLRPLFAKVFCVPATSAPVERIFSQGGIIMRPHRARMTDEVLEMLMYLRCNRC